MNILKQSTAATIKLGPFVDDTDGKTAETALTIGQADIRLSKNGGDIAQTNNATGATHDELGYYDIPLNTTDTGTLGRLRVLVSKAGALPVWQDFLIVTANVYDTFCSTGRLNVNAASLSTDAITAASVKADAVTKIQNGLATSAALDAVDNFVDTEVAAILAAVDTEVAAIKAKTDNLPASPAAVGSAMTLTAGAITSVQAGLALEATLTAIKGTGWTTETLKVIRDALTAVQADLDNPGQYKADVSGLATAEAVSAIPTTPLLAANYTAPDNTSIAAIKAKTDNLPASPAAVGSAMTLTAAYDKAKDDVLTPLAVVDSIVDAIKAQTDKIPASPASAGEYTTNIGAIKAKTDNLPLSPASSGEYTSALTAIQNDLDNPNQYKADVSNLALQATSLAIKGQTDKIPAAPAQTGEYNAALTVIQADLDNPNQYKADVSGLATSAELAQTEADIIAAMPDETVIPDGIALETSVQAIKAKTDNLPPTPASAGEYTAAIAAIPTTPLLAANYTAPDNASIATIKAKTNLIPANPAVADEYDAALAAIQADLDNPNQYKADVSALMLASSYVAPNNAGITAIKAKTDNLPANTATTLAAIQSDLDNPAQYKADVSGLATTAHVQEVENKIDAIDVTVNTIPTNPLLDTAYTAPDNAGIAAIQEKTEQLTFTAPNKVDANADVVLSPEAIEGMATAIRDGLPEDIWSSSIRTLTQSPAEIIATVLGADITQIRGDSWAVQLTGVELGSIQQLAIKHSAKQSDSAALLFVDSVNGLTVLNGVAQDGEDSSKASLTYDGTILTLTVDASITAQLPAGSLQYGIQSISNNGIVSEPYGGTFRVLADIVRATD